MKLTEIIGEGNYRTCFATDNPDICAKKLKDNIEINLIGVKIKLDTKLYTFLKNGIKDLNKHELNIINNLPNELSEYIPSYIYIQGQYLNMQRPKDFSGKYSRTVQEYGKINNPIFWKHIEQIHKVFKENKLWFSDIFHMGNNLLVQKLSEEEYKPIIIDYKRLGRSMYPLQVNLLLQSEQEKKFDRRFEIFKNIFSD